MVKTWESIRAAAFDDCPTLERITIPLDRDIISTNEEVFQECTNLNYVDLVEGEELRNTIDALLLEEWRNDMTAEIDSINQILPNTRAGYYDYDMDHRVMGEKTIVIRVWIRRVLSKIIDYEAQHRLLLDETSHAIQRALPPDIVINNVIPFLELPPYF